MKNYALLIFLAVLIAGTACSFAGPIRAGAATANITPPLGIEMNGGTSPGYATNDHDELHARALVLDGGTQRLRWDPKNPATNKSWHTFTVDRSSQLLEVWVDPDRKLLLANPLALRVRQRGDGSAAMRAGAWTGAAVQTLMQVIGP